MLPAWMKRSQLDVSHMWVGTWGLVETLTVVGDAVIQEPCYRKWSTQFPLQVGGGVGHLSQVSGYLPEYTVPQ